VINLEIVMTRRGYLNNHGPYLLGIYYALERDISYITECLRNQYPALRVVRNSKLSTQTKNTTCHEVSQRYKFCQNLSVQILKRPNPLYALNTLVFYALSPRKIVYSLLYNISFWPTQKNHQKDVKMC